MKQAFIHRSYVNEHRSTKLEHNERLEFLGDAVIELSVTDFLYKKYKTLPEGDLTAYRSALVNAVTLAEVAEKIGMNSFLLLSKGESKDTGRARQIILANAIEALVGAMYMDLGFHIADKFIKENLLHLIDDIVEQQKFIDPKSKFQERSQDKVGVTPVYKIIKESGPDHNKLFTVGVYLDEELVADGDGKSKQEAEQAAALKALEKKAW